MSVRCLSLCGLLLSVMAVAATAQEPNQDLIGDVTPAAQPKEPTAPPEDDPEKRRQAMAGLAAVAGIAIIGIALLAMTILWAGRLRRLNRKPLPDAPLKNELWFLQPPKSPPPQPDSPAPPQS